jgi:hypothetical protein
MSNEVRRADDDVASQRASDEIVGRVMGEMQRQLQLFDNVP